MKGHGESYTDGTAQYLDGKDLKSAYHDETVQIHTGDFPGVERWWRIRLQCEEREFRWSRN